MVDTQATEEQQQAPGQDPAGVEVREAELPDVGDGQSTGGGTQIGVLLDAMVPITVRLGQAQMTVREVLELGPGGVVKLDRNTGEPVDLLLRGVRFATGRLVVVDDKLGVRIEEILDTAAGDNAEE